MGNTQKKEKFALLGSSKEEDNYCPTCTYTTRFYGFIICSLLGTVLSILSWISLLSHEDRLTKFSILFTLGCIISISASCFLWGPKSQWKKMKDKKRLFTVLVFFISLIMVLVSALALHNFLLVLLFLIIEICSYYWYQLSLIPWGQKIMKKVCCLMFEE